VVRVGCAAGRTRISSADRRGGVVVLCTLRPSHTARDSATAVDYRGGVVVSIACESVSAIDCPGSAVTRATDSRVTAVDCGGSALSLRMVLGENLWRPRSLLEESSDAAHARGSGAGLTILSISSMKTFTSEPSARRQPRSGLRFNTHAGIQWVTDRRLGP
jgi:hypothetical protein